MRARPFDGDVELHNPYRRADGQIGARVEVHLPGVTRSFDSHGMTSNQVVAKIAEIEAQHAIRTGRLTGFRAIQGSEIVRGGKTYRVVDCTIMDGGVTLYLDVRLVDGSEMRRVDGFPIKKAYHLLSSVPPDAEVAAMVRAALPEDSEAVQKAHEEFVAKVKAKRP
jgi:hypothetical protein